MVGVVLFQGIVSTITAVFIIWRATTASLEDQLDRSGRLVERYFTEAAENLSVKAELLAGHQVLLDDLLHRRRDSLSHELTLFLAPLDVDAALIADADLVTVATGGSRELVGAATKANLLLSYNTGGRIVFIPSGNKLHMWSLYPIHRGSGTLGILAVGINCDKVFLSRIEEFSNASLILSYRKATMIEGHMSDSVFLEYARRAYAEPGQAESGLIESLSYRMLRFERFKDLTAVYFLDNAEAGVLIFQYTASAVLILLLILGAAIGTAFWLYRISFHKPFLKFQEAVRTIAAGDLSFRAQRVPRDEFGDLEREFEVMTANLKKLEGELQLSSRMAAVGEMVAGVAHQIRNPLGVMKVSTDLLRDYFSAERDPEGNYRHLVEMVGDEIDSLSVLISHFLDFTRPLHIDKEDIDIGKLVRHTIDMVPPEKRRGLEVRVQIEDEPLVRSVDAPLVQQVLVNLIINALEASSPGQTVEVNAAPQGDRGLVLTVRDQGGGIAEADQDNLFHPFFTTKQDGTGLGLSIVHRIVEGLGGTIEFATNPGEETLFTVRL